MNRNKGMFLATYIVCGVSALAPIWFVKYPPMTDLPQYAAQLSIIKNLHNSAFAFEGVFQVSWYSPYLLAMGLARFFYEFFDVLTALKITLSVSILALPLSIAALLKAAEADPWLAVLGVPLSYGLSLLLGSFMFPVRASIRFCGDCPGTLLRTAEKDGKSSPIGVRLPPVVFRPSHCPFLCNPHPNPLPLAVRPWVAG
jgi:hypothetical protein